MFCSLCYANRNLEEEPMHLSGEAMDLESRAASRSHKGVVPEISREVYWNCVSLPADLEP